MLCFLLVGRRRKEEKKRKSNEKWPETFFPGPDARHTLMAVPGRIFMAFRCN
jgi:hypothetical protein